MTNFGTVFLHVCDSSSENHRFLLLEETINATIMMKLSPAASTCRMKLEFVSVHYLFMISKFKLTTDFHVLRCLMFNAQLQFISFFFSFYCSLNDFSSRHIPVLMLELENKLLQFHLGFQLKMLLFRE